MNLLFVSDDGMMYGYDTNGDGQVDMMTGMAEINGQMTDVTAVDTDANGIYDTFVTTADNNCDGLADAMSITHDYDQDGRPDNIRMYADRNGDGDFDTVIKMHADSVNPDVAYNAEIDIDYDGDHRSDYHYEDTIPADSPYADYQFTPTSMGSAAADGTFDPDTPSDQVSGEPAKDMDVWEFQGPTNRCALYSQKFVIEQLTGQDIDIEDFADIAKENGWFTEDRGTMSLNMNKMLEYYHIDHDVVYDSNMEDLESALNNGEKVIVSVDSGQIWEGESNDIFSPATTSDHALEVIGIDYSTPGEPMVILNDSGHPNGCGEMVPLSIFEDAWSAGDHQMIVCRA